MQSGAIQPGSARSGTGARFAQAQIDAAKIIQTARHREWAAERQQGASPGNRVDPFRATTPGNPNSARRCSAPSATRLPCCGGHGGRSLLDARAADLIQVGGPDLLAGQAALEPLYDIAN